MSEQGVSKNQAQRQREQKSDNSASWSPHQYATANGPALGAQKNPHGQFAPPTINKYASIPSRPMYATLATIVAPARAHQVRWMQTVFFCTQMREP